MAQVFCGNCGSATEGRFCGACGQEVVAAGAPPVGEATIVRPIGQAAPQAAATPPAVPPSPEPVPAQSTPSSVGPPAVPPAPGPNPAQAAPGAGPATATQVSNPFAGMAVRDYVLDGVAAGLLFWALGLDWTLRADSAGGYFTLAAGGSVWWVLISLLLAVAALAVPYVQRAGFLGGLDRRQARVVKLGLLAPALLSILVNLVFTAINSNGNGDSMTGIGGGVVVVSGALVLVSLPRSYDVASDIEDMRWRVAGLGIAAAGVVIGLLTTLINIIDEDLFSSEAGDQVIVLLTFYVLPFVAVTVIPLVRALHNTFAGVVVLTWVGGTAVGHQILANFGDSPAFSGGLSTFTHAVTPATFLVAAGGLVFVSGALVVRTTAARTVDGWIQVALLSAVLTAIVAGLFALSAVVFLVNDAGEQGKVVTLLIMSMLIAAAAGVSANLLRHQARASRALVVGAAAVNVVLGIVVVAMLNSGGGPVGMPWWGTAALLALPVLTGCALTSPKSVRDELGPIVVTAAPPQGGSVQ